MTIHNDLHPQNRNTQSRKMQSRDRWVLIGFLAVAGFFLLTEHRAHLLGILPYLLLLACPLMHRFMHHGHRGDGHDTHRHEPPEGEPK